MRALAVDVGTGTQDILLFDSTTEIENCVQLILPSPTRLVAERVRRATAAGLGIAVTGVTMGGGPCSWAVEDHLRSGLPLYATRLAAQTLDDDLERVAALGIRLIDDPSEAPSDFETIVFGDFDLASLEAALRPFDISLSPDSLDAIALAVFDHGNAPPGFSDRAFRFEYLAETVRQNDLSAFGYFRDEIPERLTRMRSVASLVPEGYPLLVMDTGPAAVLGALDDPMVNDLAQNGTVIANIGNFHTLAFHLIGSELSLTGGLQIAGMFEHHTGELTVPRLESYLRRLAQGKLDNAEVFADQGHGALIALPEAPLAKSLAVVGPRREMLRKSDLAPYFAVPHGDMMLSGSYGLLRALARKRPEWKSVISERLGDK